MMAPHEVPIPGPAADFAATLSGLIPVLTTERLILRAPCLADFPVWAQILCGNSGPHLGGPFTREEAFTEFAAAIGLWLLRGHGTWTVETKNGQTAGFVLIGFEPGDREPELGFLFHVDYRGKGLAHEAACAARSHAFDRLDMPTLVSMIDPENKQSQRVAQRLGARLDGTIDGDQIWRHERPTA